MSPLFRHSFSTFRSHRLRRSLVFALNGSRRTRREEGRDDPEEFRPRPLGDGAEVGRRNPQCEYGEITWLYLPVRRRGLWVFMKVFWFQFFFYRIGDLKEFLDVFPLTVFRCAGTPRNTRHVDELSLGVKVGSKYSHP